MGIAVCQGCNSKFVVSQVKQVWEHRCPNCNGKLLRDGEDVARSLAGEARDLVKHSRHLIDNWKFKRKGVSELRREALWNKSLRDAKEHLWQAEVALSAVEQLNDKEVRKLDIQHGIQLVQEVREWLGKVQEVSVPRGEDV